MAEFEHFEVPAVSDCPIQPQVWRAFVDGRDERIEVIAHLRPDVNARRVAEQIVGVAGISTSDSAPLLFDQYLLLDVTIVDLVSVLLPLTRWSDFLQRVRQAEADVGNIIDRQAELVASGRERGTFKPPLQAPAGPSVGLHRLLGHEDLSRLRWLLSVLLATGHTSTSAAALVRAGAQATQPGASSILSVGHNRWTEPAVNVTNLTIKADAARRLFEINCSDVTWAVVDTGIDFSHRMFLSPSKPGEESAHDGFGGVGRSAHHADPNARHGADQDDGADVGLGGSRVLEAYDVPRAIEALRLRPRNDGMDSISTDADWEEFAEAARVIDDWSARDTRRFEVGVNDHGTHVAGILGGREQERHEIEGDHWGRYLLGDEPEAISGLCPNIRMVDIRVFNDEGRCREMDVVVGLAFIRWLNRVRERKIDGVNLSISVPFAVDNFACGWTPVCVECDRLSAAGVVVVAAAGNAGYDDAAGPTSVGAGFQSMSISDPGNARTVITVGATDRRDPHRFGPIALSARGPTADGRHKPDVLAPGEGVWGPVPDDGWGRKSGTSQAAPHVSAIAAMLLHRYPELRGRPDRVKEIICETATDLGRLVDFQGHGLVDALRALQYP